jgi:hypothetical protein
MPRFRDRPLSWLFIIATACIDLVAITHLVNHESNWYGALAVGQMCLVGALLAAGRAHRLLRAGLFLAVPILLSAPDYRASDWALDSGEIIQIEGVAPYVLGVSFVIAALVSFFSFALIGLNAVFVRRPSTESAPRFQFPIIEFFGWTIIVAVSTLVMRFAEVGWFEDGLLAAVAALTLFPAALVVYFYSPRRTWFLRAALIVSAAVSLCELIIQSEDLEWVVMAGAYAYVAAWLLVKRMDESRNPLEADAASSAPAAKPLSPLADE